MLCYVMSCYVGGTILRRHGSPEWSKSLIKLNQNWGFWDFAESRSSRWNTFRFPKFASGNGEIVLEKGGFVSGKCLRIYHFSDFKEIELVRGNRVRDWKTSSPRAREKSPKRMTMDSQICICPYTSPSICDFLDFLESMDFSQIERNSK